MPECQAYSPNIVSRAQNQAGLSSAEANPILSKYNLNDDYAETTEYQSLYTELIGTIVILLKMSYNKKTHLRQNIDAIKLALRLDKENRPATPEERKYFRLFRFRWNKGNS